MDSPESNPKSCRSALPCCPKSRPVPFAPRQFGAGWARHASVEDRSIAFGPQPPTTDYDRIGRRRMHVVVAAWTSTDLPIHPKIRPITGIRRARSCVRVPAVDSNRGEKGVGRDRLPLDQQRAAGARRRLLWTRGGGGDGRSSGLAAAEGSAAHAEAGARWCRRPRSTARARSVTSVRAFGVGWLIEVGWSGLGSGYHPHPRRGSIRSTRSGPSIDASTHIRPRHACDRDAQAGRSCWSRSRRTAGARWASPSRSG